MNNFDFNIFEENFDDIKTFRNLPSGEYKVRINKCELQATNSNKNKEPGHENSFNLVVVYEVIEHPEHAGYKLREWLTVYHPSAKAQQWGRKRLKDTVIAAGLKALNSPDNLVGSQIMLKVELKNDSYSSSGYKNEIVNRFACTPSDKEFGEEFKDKIPF